MKQFWHFLKTVLSSNSEASAKRINGTIGYIACTVCICGWHPEHLSELLFISAGLLAAGLLEKVQPKQNQ